MGAVTYPEAAVISFVNNSLIPLQIIAGTQPWSTDFNVKWTPTLITLDAQGKEHHRTLGFLGAQDLIASQLLGIAKVYFDEDKPEETLTKLDKLLTDYPQSAAAPEAIYLRGVCRYKSTKVAKHLKEAWEKLKADYPQSEWTMRAEPYEAL